MSNQAVENEKNTMLELISRIVRECPRRQPTSEDERRASEIMQEELARRGLSTQVEPFRFNSNLYANVTTHFGLGVLGTVVSGVTPLAGLALHLLAGGSYWADSTRRAYLLRRLFPFRNSQNVLGVMPAEGEPALRIVLNAHVDAAFTGVLFNPKTIALMESNRLPKQLDFVRRSLALATWSQFILAGFDLLRIFAGPLSWPLRPLEFLITVPALLAFLFALEVVLRNRIVPGANDDLSGVAALPILAERLARTKPPEVELVFLATGCEEASLGGADALARAKKGIWDPERTVFISLDSITNGDLRYISLEGEVVRTPIPRWLDTVVHEVIQADERFTGVEGYEIPVGATDAAAFLAHGFDAMGLICIDPQQGAPRHYHMPSDTPENLDLDQLSLSVDFTEQLVRGIMRHRLG